MNNQKIHLLAFAAHPDDVELSAGGTLLKHKSLGYTTGIIDLTRGELGTRGTSETRKQESEDSSKILGIDIRENLGMDDGFFEETKENLLKIIYAIRKYQPEIVLANALSDRHPDHGNGAHIVARACFLSGLSKIITTHQGESQQVWRPKHIFHYIQDHFMKPDFVIDVTAWHEQKMKAISAFKTQFYNPESKEPSTPISGKEFWDLLYGKAQLMGRYIGCTYGEGFIAASPFEIEELK
ncbi:MAG: bacillithiol biosynthesis deacetylase BshB1 [Bacteroidetes bacterium]|nr:bacillithiol biosynthesis deacetylase BshB1 [Bacteroidota bacterium]